MPTLSAMACSVAGDSSFSDIWGDARSGGKSVWLTTADSDTLLYAHLDQWKGEGRDVNRGEVIGYVGSTGKVDGSHLHFEVPRGGEAINP